MSRLLVDSTTRPDIDLPKHLGMSEFSVVPLPLLTPGGSLYYPKDKAASIQISNCHDLGFSHMFYRHDNQ